MRKIYIAGPFFNDEQLSLIKQIECILDGKYNNFSPRKFGILKDMTREEKIQNAKDIFDKNIKELQSCDLIIAVIDDYDSGTIFEIGYFAALGKKIITVSNKNYGINIMLKGCVNAHVTDLDKLLHTIEYTYKCIDLDKDYGDTF